MSTQKRANGEKNRGSSGNQPGSGSKYHEEHAGKVTGYGQPDPNAEGLTNLSDKPSS
ncbi:hypothetical protein RCG19_21780 [Neobacillus sp. OS1-2]|uniref:hypothetical protein n=1 Tax=Neobacillus sp. OS1-2 TaxID=3070680 RepID=UPI0027DFDF72|nr:hypothetical protein [Neobacillus sp. OS1-2]WML39769.1 hypothetical protein RCG19_21780 [Neobacillus sp. OS1-2]